MTAEKRPAQIRVLMVGPAAPAVGGMVSVMETLVASPLCQAVRLSVLPNNPPWASRWGLPGAAFRHLALLILLTWRVLRRRIDLVHIHTCSFFSFYRNLVDLALLRVLRRKVILHLHGCHFAEFYEKSGPLGRALIRAGLQGADAVVVLSHRWRQWTHTVAPQAQVRVIPNGVSVPRPTIDGDPQPNGPCRFLFLALMDEPKGLFDLLTAAGRLQSEAIPFELTLAGPWASRRDQERFRDLLRRYGLEEAVEYVGVADPQRRARLLAGGQVFVSPSHGEVMPMSILEAMSHALPIIGSDVGAVAETVGDGAAGLIIKPGDQEALAGAMRKLSQDPALRSKLGQEARRRVACTYSDTVQAERVLGLYRALLPAGPGRLLPANCWSGLGGRSTIKPTCRQVDTKL